MRYIRSILAVIIGSSIFVVTAVALFQVSGRNSHAVQPLWFMALATLCGIVFAGIGGAVATLIAPSRLRAHAAALGLLIGLGAAVSLLKSPATDATWSMWSALFVMGPSAYVGGRLRTRSIAS